MYNLENQPLVTQYPYIELLCRPSPFDNLQNMRAANAGLQFRTIHREKARKTKSG